VVYTVSKCTYRQYVRLDQRLLRCLKDQSPTVNMTILWQLQSTTFTNYFW